MNLPFAIRTIRWMVRDTFRQSLHTKLFWVMLALTLVCVGFCFSISVSGDMPPTTLAYEIPAYITQQEAERIGLDKVKADGVRIINGEVSFGFGLIKVPVGRHRGDAVRFVQLWLAAALADTVGVLLSLLWTAGFLPTFLEPQAATILLAKPAPRWSVLVGKYIGVVLFVSLHAVLFVGGTWLAIGLRTGVWNGSYWLAVPLLVMNFAIFFSVSTFLAVATRSTVACIFGTLLFWLLCWALNFTHLRLIAYPVEGLSGVSQTMLEIGYWIFPKPLDLGGIFFDAMRADGFSMKLPELIAAQEKGQFHPELSIATSAAFAAGTLALAANEFRTMDY